MDDLPTSPLAQPMPRASAPSIVSTHCSRSDDNWSTAEDPVPWRWQCHVCNRRYQVGVTRRCLEDGHYFCTGRTLISGVGEPSMVVEHPPCTSVFDYCAWESIGEERRRLIRDGSDGRTDCWSGCDWPGSCIWEKEQMLLRTREEEAISRWSDEERIEEEEVSVNGRQASVTDAAKTTKIGLAGSDTIQSRKIVVCMLEAKTTEQVDSVIDQKPARRRSKFLEHMDEEIPFDRSLAPSPEPAACRTTTTNASKRRSLEIRKKVRKVVDKASEVLRTR
ncbi:hypothetical protein ANO11243_046240 [Dothideomycetidae sp. 11243]|nr:hypothetical protein ANO11243_046240 [fungal sp. No.11243]